MADTKLSALAAVTSLADSDLLYTVASSASKGITALNLALAVQGKLDMEQQRSFAVREQQSSGTDGGTFTSGSWQTRTLNTTEQHTSAYVALSSNELTVPAGKWLVWWSAPARSVGSHQTRLIVNEAGTPEYHYGESSYAGTAESVQTQSGGCAIIDKSSSFTLKLQHRCEATRATFGLGTSTGWGTEVYASLFGIRIGAATP